MFSPKNLKPGDITKPYIPPPLRIEKGDSALLLRFKKEISKREVLPTTGTAHSLKDEDLYPYRYASFYIFEANNKTK